MENTTAKIEGFDIKVILRESVAQGYVKRVECRNYQFINGDKVACALTQHAFDFQKKFEIYKEVREYSSKYTPAHTYEFYLIYIEDELLDVGKITSFRELKTKIVLEVYIGADQ